jgi:hypothetical protein
MTNDGRMQRESNLIATIRNKLPEFAKACADEMELVLLHQDAFAADYQEDEYRRLLGMAIKYAGLACERGAWNAPHDRTKVFNHELYGSTY